ncbi:hypothetical protein C0Q70_07719 [Pomacea canaliculata]|uniref:SAM domain-containing protein n=1 Tax=Pomacea canaliculata TaxID=400727 RepID=A0A2T7PFT1_POMCA|nr:hypothetical protein C0Q70_07719 [Pomacea canaliculata]
MKMPVHMSFARKDNLVFSVNPNPVNHTFFGDLVLVAVHLVLLTQSSSFTSLLELFLSADGKPREKLQVLPRRLNQVLFSLVNGLVGVKDPQEKLKPVIKELTAASAKYSLDNDPFYQELAIVDKNRRVMTEAEIPDYIEHNTFIDISYKRREVPDIPGGPPRHLPRLPAAKASDADIPVTRKIEVNKSKDDTRSAMKKPMFTWTMSRMFTVRDVFNGMVGDVPLLLSVTSGFYRNSSGPHVNHMEKFETGERAFQRRVLLHDSQNRTLSLPQSSPILFRVNGLEKTTTLDDVVKTTTLPVRLSFAQKEDLLFIVDRSYRTHEYFGDLTLVSVYLERFICCLSVRNEDGKVTDKVVSLPCRLRQLGISMVNGIQGESGRQEKFRELLKTYKETAEKFPLPKELFFTELALISRKTKIINEADIPDYIDENTFIDILMKRSGQRQDDGQVNAPPTIPNDQEESLYDTLSPSDKDSHLYISSQSDAIKNFPMKENLQDNSSTLKTNVVVKTQQPLSPSSKQVITELQQKLSTEVPPPLSNRPQVAPPSVNATPISSPAPALPPVSHRAPLRSTGSGEASENPQTLMLSPASSRPNLFQVPDQAMSRSTRPLQDPPRGFDIERLSVNDVCRRLKDLGLEKHCKKFKKSLIDGKLLKRITRRALEEDFRLSEVEIVKLSAFIDEGHIPQ